MMTVLSVPEASDKVHFPVVRMASRQGRTFFRLAASDFQLDFVFAAIRLRTSIPGNRLSIRTREGRGETEGQMISCERQFVHWPTGKGVAHINVLSRRNASA